VRDIGHQELRLRDGRILEYATAGPAGGMPLIFNTGSPGSGELFQPLVDAAARFGLRTVVYSRPGFGASSPQPDRQVASAAPDVAELLNALGGERFVTIGWSGGGPHALACAALLAGQCAGIACVSSIAPMGTDLDWYKGMNAGNTEVFTLAAAGADAVRPLVERSAEDLAKMSTAVIGKSLTTRTDLDQGEVAAFREFLALTLNRSVVNGWHGSMQDDLAFVGPWGFDVASIAAPTSVWHGDTDALVPASHGEWIAAHIRGARLHILAGETHISLLPAAYRQIIRELAEMSSPS
jgi:pimeloyl-ACP methyl ester carboxylesterase